MYKFITSYLYNLTIRKDFYFLKRHIYLFLQLFFPIYGVSVLPVLLGLVESRIRALEQRGIGKAAIGRKGDAHARRKIEAAVFLTAAAAAGIANLFRLLISQFPASAVAQKYDELIAAHTAYDVRRTEQALQLTGNLPQDTIPLQVAKIIIDLLEAV